MIQQTVAAIATPPGRGGIAVIRISGPESARVADKVFSPKATGKAVEGMAGYTALFGQMIFRQKPVDEGIALRFCAPHSYTGEDVVELSCHGGEQVSAEVLQACLEAGADPAPPGEFTKRAVLNGRLGLTQAEAVMDLISATSRQGVAAAKAVLSGQLFAAIEKQKKKLVNLAGHLAAYTDYPEEDVEVLEEGGFLQTVGEVEAELSGMIEAYDKGLVLRRGVLAAIVGSPNVGKSTLFNLLSGFERAIVTPVAGTTRDVVREQIQLGGITLHLADTAGLHETGDVVEREGIRRSYDELEQAGLVLAVFDGSLPFGKEEIELAARLAGRPALAIINKSDLGLQADEKEIASCFTEVITVSAKEEETRQKIENAVIRILKVENVDVDAGLLANERQLSAVSMAREALRLAADTLQRGLTLDAAGVYLDDALAALAALTGEDAGAAVLEDVFSRFCVGK